MNMNTAHTTLACHQCRDPIQSGDQYVFEAQSDGQNRRWHIHCFIETYQRSFRKLFSLLTDEQLEMIGLGVQDEGEEPDPRFGLMEWRRRLSAGDSVVYMGPIITRHRTYTLRESVGPEDWRVEEANGFCPQTSNLYPPGYVIGADS